MLAMYCNVAHDNKSQLLPYVQMAHNTAYSSTRHKTPLFLMFGRVPTLPMVLIMRMPQTELPDTALQYTRETVEKLKLAYELARQNLDERGVNSRNVKCRPTVQTVSVR